MEMAIMKIRIRYNHFEKRNLQSPPFRPFFLQFLATIIESLPMLTHLDISGTNLAGTGVAQFKASDSIRSSDIPGLVSRATNPLQFLGLYNTAHSACRRYDIPAVMVCCLYD